MNSVKDYRVTVKVRNNRILRAIEDAGAKLGQKWCNSVGVNYAAILGFVNMTASPLAPDGSLREVAFKLCDVLNKIPEELWSKEQLYPLEKNFSEMEMDHEQILLMQSLAHENSYLPDFSALEERQTGAIVRNALKSLSGIQREVIALRFGLDCEALTLEEVGKKLNLTRERIRMIESRALRKLRCRNQAVKLAACLDDGQKNRMRIERIYQEVGK